MRSPRLVILVAVAVFTVAACDSSSTTGETSLFDQPSITDVVVETVASTEAATTLFSERMDSIDGAVAVWRNASSIEEAQAAAEGAANLIVGPNGPGYDDRDGDGAIGGESTVGVLPGLDGAPIGLATPLAANECVVRDVLGSTWNDPSADWGAMLTAIDAWRTDKNTMPTLASHPMRIVGWATLTLGSGLLDDAHEFAGHAKLHVDITRRALDC